jgi:hypothetical protein
MKTYTQPYTTIQQLELDLAALDRLAANKQISLEQHHAIRTSLFARYTNVGGVQQMAQRIAVTTKAYDMVYAYLVHAEGNSLEDLSQKAKDILSGDYFTKGRGAKNYSAIAAVEPGKPGEEGIRVTKGQEIE